MNTIMPSRFRLIKMKGYVIPIKTSCFPHFVFTVVNYLNIIFDFKITLNTIRNCIYIPSIDAKDLYLANNFKDKEKNRIGYKLTTKTEIIFCKFQQVSHTFRKFFFYIIWIAQANSYRFYFYSRFRLIKMKGYVNKRKIWKIQGKSPFILNKWIPLCRIKK